VGSPLTIRTLRLTLLLLLVASGANAGARAQQAPRRFPADSTGDLRRGAAVLASALLPGAGQKLLGSDRWVPYLAIEVWAWLTYRDRLREGTSFRNDYRELASSVARRVGVGPHRDTVFEYYEALSKHEASGSFDSNPVATGVQPETDPATFNGEVWRLARELYFPSGVQSAPTDSPEYTLALSYYERKAVPPSYAWAWGDSELEQRVFTELVHRTDEAFRASSRALGVILANHVASAVDALIAARLSSVGVSPDRLQFLNGFMPGIRGLRWTAGVRIIP
jgi:hypothetical protein